MKGVSTSKILKDIQNVSVWIYEAVEEVLKETSIG